MRARELDEKHVSLRGHRLPREFIRNRYQRVCGPCLGESAHHRLAWDLAFLGACSKHKNELIDRCTNCGQMLGWNRPSVTHCACGANLVQQSGPPITQEDADAIDAILQRFEADADHPANPSSPDGLPLAEFVDLILFLGRNSLYVSNGIPQQGRTMDRPDLMQVLRWGVFEVQRWPQRFHQLLDRCRDRQREDQTAVALSGHFGPIYRTIARLELAGWGGMVRDAFRAYLAANPDIPYGGSSAAVVSGLTGGSAYVTPSEAAEMLRVNAVGLSQLMRSPAGERVRSTGNGGSRRYVREDVEELARQLSDAINLKVLSERLGLYPSAAVRKVAEGGVFPVVDRSHFGIRKGFYVSAREVESFFHRLDAAAAQGTAVGRTVGFASAASTFRRQGVDLAALLEMMKRGEIEPVGFAPGGKGLYRYLFDHRQLTSRGRTVSTAVSESLSAVMAAKCLTVHISVIYDLVKLGLLEKQELGAGGPHGLRIARADILEFNERYVTGSALARELRVDPRIFNRLAEQSDLPRKAVGVVGHRKTPIYRRHSMEVNHIAALVRRERKSRGG